MILEKGINVRSGSSNFSKVVDDLKYEDQIAILAESETRTYGKIAEANGSLLIPLL